MKKIVEGKEGKWDFQDRRWALKHRKKTTGDERNWRRGEVKYNGWGQRLDKSASDLREGDDDT